MTIEGVLTHPRHLFVTFTTRQRATPIMTSTNTRSLRASQLTLTDFVDMLEDAAANAVHVVFAETEYALPLVREAIARLVSDPMSGRVQALLTEHAPHVARLATSVHAGSTFSVDNRRRIVRASAADAVKRRVKNNVVMLDAGGSNPMRRIVETACFLREGDVLVLTNVGSSALRTYRNRILDFAETGVLWALGSLSPVVSLPPRVTVVVLEGCAVTSHIDERGMVSSR